MPGPALQPLAGLGNVCICYLSVSISGSLFKGGEFAEDVGRLAFVGRVVLRERWG